MLTPAVLGVALSTAALFVAVRFIGPVVRASFGEPFGYAQDYTTREAWLQAAIVRITSVAAAFLGLGVVLARFRVRRSWTLALALANPFTVGTGYALYQYIWSGEFAGEYFGFVGLGLLAFVAPLIFAPCVVLGLSTARGR